MKLSKEYGLNPTIPVCFYCGKETGEIALLGANYKGEAPMHMCISLEPCEECKKKFEGYVLLIEAIGNTKPEPTGRWMAVKKECINIPNKGICYVSQSDYNDIMRNAVKEEK